MAILRERLKKYPKIELHLHIDGSVRPKTVSELLKLPLPEVEAKMMVDKKTHSLTEYLTKFDLPILAMQKKEHIVRIIEELLEDLKSDHVIYAELRFAPLFHTKEGLTIEDVVKTILDTMKKEAEIKTNLILCCMRQDIEEGNIHNLETIEVAKKYGLAVDLAGDESHYPTILFSDLFEKIRNAHLPFTIHAGEAAGSDSIEAALSFGTKRIGHGIRAMESPSLLKRLKHENVTLEICPDSNIDTLAVSKKEDHPIKELYSQVSVTVSTDNRTVSGIDLTKEYQDLIELMHFTIDDIKQLNLNAIHASFLDEKEKEELRKKIEEGYRDATY